MIRIRQQNSNVIEVPDGEATEILDSKGALAVVIYKDHKGTIRVLMPGDPLFNGYIRTHGMTAANVHQHKQLPLKPAPM